MESSKRFEKAKYGEEKEQKEERDDSCEVRERTREEHDSVQHIILVCAHAYNAYLIFISYIYC